MKNGYFNYLCRLVGGGNKYSKLLGKLYATEFYSLIPNDDNRGADGKQLRNNYINEEGPQALLLFDLNECTVFEMLIGLSFRLEFESMSSLWEKTPKEWFWILLDNLGLRDYDDVVYEQPGVENQVNEILEIFLDRQYKRDGNGGLFPLKTPRKDQRRIEIWYQMSAYILENYPN